MPIEIPAKESLECHVVLWGGTPGRRSVTFNVYVDANGYLHIEDVDLVYTSLEGEIPEEYARRMGMIEDDPKNDTGDQNDKPGADFDSVGENVEDGSEF